MARKIARVVVSKRLAACVNVALAVESVYRWKGRVEKAREQLLIIKTTRARLPELEREVRQLHGYELPEFLVVPAEAGSAKYLEWVAGSVR